MTRRRTSVAALCLLLLCWAVRGLGATDQPITLTVQVIHASNDGQVVDPSLAKLRSQLSSLKFNSYRLLETHPLSMTVGARHTLGLPGGRTLDLYPYGVSGGKLELLVTVTDSGTRLLDTTIRLPNGGSVVVAGPSFGDGVLIVALSGSF